MIRLHEVLANSYTVLPWRSTKQEAPRSIKVAMNPEALHYLERGLVKLASRVSKTASYYQVARVDSKDDVLETQTTLKVFEGAV